MACPARWSVGIKRQPGVCDGPLSPE